MESRIAKIASSLKQIGDIQVTEWDFMGLLNTEIRELEFARSLRRLGAIRVTEWDFSEVIPAIRETANREVDLSRIFRKAARTRIMERDFNSKVGSVENPSSSATLGKHPKRERVKANLEGFLGYAVAHLIDEPEQARIRLKEMGPSGLCFQVLLAERDVAALIGRGGHTAAALRRILQAVGARDGVQVLLHIQTHEAGEAG